MHVKIQRGFPGFEASLDEKVERSLILLKTWEPRAIQADPQNGYWGCDSGGKDSGCIRELAKMAGVAVAWNYNVTTVDPLEIHSFLRQEHPDTTWHHKPRSLFRVLADDRGFPTRLNRWCCQEFKEGGGAGKFTITGVRWAESNRRKKTWKAVQRFDATRNHGQSLDASVMVNPLVTWSDADVWDFTRSRKIPYCSLYDEGYKRLGCVGCPQRGAKGVAVDFARWPQYERGWRRAFHRLWRRRRGMIMQRGKYRGQPWPGTPGIVTADQLFDWWVGGGDSNATEGDECQLGLW